MSSVPKYCLTPHGIACVFNDLPHLLRSVKIVESLTALACILLLESGSAIFVGIVSRLFSFEVGWVIMPDKK